MKRKIPDTKNKAIVYCSIPLKNVLNPLWTYYSKHQLSEPWTNCEIHLKAN